MPSTPLAPGDRLVVASHNPGKVWEIKELVRPYGLDAVSAGDLGLAEPDETEATFAGNARLKALAAATAAGLPALADDSGLEVACLGGAPGIYSARWAGPAKDFARAMAKVAEEIGTRHGWAAPGPRANFTCALCLARPDGEYAVFEGRVDGHLVWPPRGGNGFGYDPMFVPAAEARTFGEMPPAEKYAMSHRTRAFALFERACLSHLPRASAPAYGVSGEGLSAAAANLSTRAELAAFMANLANDLAQHRDTWTARDLPAFLEALARATEATSPLDGEPAWRTLAKAMLAAAGRRP
ncbi:MAG: RdgB/HAM1 family non-canonical purine NTP pyrophosphatase [Hyphomicrobiaceae bacterium]|nr:RdgB/HAM1 family non-canonical purine NTP pyrophosphatase [Hyphomicrobiaceae bacterium]